MNSKPKTLKHIILGTITTLTIAAAATTYVTKPFTRPVGEYIKKGAEGSICDMVILYPSPWEQLKGVNWTQKNCYAHDYCHAHKSSSEGVDEITFYKVLRTSEKSTYKMVRIISHFYPNKEWLVDDDVLRDLKPEEYKQEFDEANEALRHAQEQ